MKIQKRARILGTALLLSECAAGVSVAQEQGPIAPTPNTTITNAEDKSSAETATPLEASAVARKFEGTPVGLAGRFASDQQRIWTSPSRLQLLDADWLLPLGAVTGGLLATDREFSRHLSHDPRRISHYNTLSNAGVAALVGGGAGMWLIGHAKHNDHWSETGFLAGEAALNSLVMVEGLKYSLRRERPFQGSGNGSFFQRGGTSFPSEHSAAAWSVAGVIAHEYPGPFTKIMAYGLASLVDVSRVRARQHFPSDVVVGSMIGNLVAQSIYRHHHDPDLGGSVWQTYGEGRAGASDGNATTIGSPFVELESWIYPAIERLAALGYIHSEFLDMRPWTRSECRRLIEEAGDAIQADAAVPDEAGRLYSELLSEFGVDLERTHTLNEPSARLESVYARATNISGPPLHDSYHFGQTIINDYGRPYEEGFNTYEGVSGYATAGRFTFYVRGEYQHAPSAPAYPLAVRQVIASVDQKPLQPGVPFATINEFIPLDTYISARAGSWDLSFGRQSLWWGPAEGGAFLFSDNAEPIYMFRASQVAPFQLPWIFSKLGPIKLDMFMGKLSGNEFPPRPLIHGNKVSFKPTQNLDIGITATSEFGGVGRPLTLLAIVRSYFSRKSSDLYPGNANPGKRTIGLDASYRVPGARNWLSLYVDGLLPEDNPTNRDMSVSLVYLYRRFALRPGLYVSRLPKLPKLDFRVEAVYTDPPTPRSHAGLYIYFNDFYHDLYTNKGNLIGDWIGREATGFQGWTTYHFNSHSFLQFGYRHAKVAPDFIPNGETLNDGSVRLDWWVSRDWSFSTFVQYEKWKAPVLAPSAQTNWTSSVEVAFWPKSGSK